MARKGELESSFRNELIGAYREAVESPRELRRRFELMTRREAEVLGQLMLGKQVTEIASVRVVSESTVRTQVEASLAMLEVSSQLSAVDWHTRSVGAHPSMTTGAGGGATSPRSANQLRARR